MPNHTEWILCNSTRSWLANAFAFWALSCCLTVFWSFGKMSFRYKLLCSGNFLWVQRPVFWFRKIQKKKHMCRPALVRFPSLEPFNTQLPLDIYFFYEMKVFPSCRWQTQQQVFLTTVFASECSKVWLWNRCVFLPKKRGNAAWWGTSLLFQWILFHGWDFFPVCTTCTAADIRGVSSAGFCLAFSNSSHISGKNVVFPRNLQDL